MARITVEVPQDVAAKIDREAGGLLLGRGAYVRALLAAVARELREPARVEQKAAGLCRVDDRDSESSG